MQPIVKTTFALLVLALLGPPHGWADEVVMTSGERFTTTKVWEEGDKIRFSMQGLVVSVHKSEVAAVIRGNAPVPASKPDPAPVPTPVPMVHGPDPKTPPPTTVTPSPPPAKPLRRPRSTNEGDRPSTSPAPTGVKGTGLEGVTWRMAPKDLPGMVKIKTDPLYGGLDAYRRPDMGLQLGSAPLDGWTYNFWRDQLYSIILWADGRIGYERMKREIFARYGKGLQRRPEVERFVWDDDPSQRMLEFDDTLNSGIFIMRSSELDRIIKERYPASPSTSPSTSPSN